MDGRKKLTDEEVREIREAISNGSKQVDLAEEYDVSRKHIGDIKRRLTRTDDGRQNFLTDDQVREIRAYLRQRPREDWIG